jgi:hypothetical protein
LIKPRKTQKETNQISNHKNDDLQPLQQSNSTNCPINLPTNSLSTLVVFLFRNVNRFFFFFFSDTNELETTKREKEFARKMSGICQLFFGTSRNIESKKRRVLWLLIIAIECVCVYCRVYVFVRWWEKSFISWDCLLRVPCIFYVNRKINT